MEHAFPVTPPSQASQDTLVSLILPASGQQPDQSTSSFCPSISSIPAAETTPTSDRQSGGRTAEGFFTLFSSSTLNLLGIAGLRKPTVAQYRACTRWGKKQLIQFPQPERPHFWEASLTATSLQSKTTWRESYFPSCSFPLCLRSLAQQNILLSWNFCCKLLAAIDMVK